MMINYTIVILHCQFIRFTEGRRIWAPSGQ